MTTGAATGTWISFSAPISGVMSGVDNVEDGNAEDKALWPSTPRALVGVNIALWASYGLGIGRVVVVVAGGWAVGDGERTAFS